MTIDAQRLSTVVAEQIRCAEAMLEALARESQALADGKHDALALAADAKAELVTALERLESERRELAEVGGAAEAADWQRLRELIAQCKQQNERNGTLLKVRAENVRTALNAFRGGEPELYGATGRSSPRTDPRPLGTA
jgi:flagellar biosynthesis protein FlgN